MALAVIRKRTRWQRQQRKVAPTGALVAAIALAAAGCIVNIRKLPHAAFVGGCGAWSATPQAAGLLDGRLLQTNCRAQEDVLAEAQAALEAARLELQATKLRAEAEELERQSAVDRRLARARQLLGERSAAEGLSQGVLQQSLKEELQLDVAEDRVRWLMDSSGRVGEATLRFEDLKSEAFEAALDRLVLEVQEAGRKAVLEDRERLLKVRREQPPASQESAGFSLGEVNDDRGVITRLLGSLAYTLPLLDGLQFGLPLVQVLPALAPVFNVLLLPTSLLNAIPFGSLIFFIILTVLANNRDLPRLLRFNLQQAVLLDIALFVPSLLVSLVSMATGGGAGVAEELGVVIFPLLLACIAYSVALTLLGQDPDGLPVISPATKRSIDGPGV